MTQARLRAAMLGIALVAWTGTALAQPPAAPQAPSPAPATAPEGVPPPSPPIVVPPPGPAAIPIGEVAGRVDETRRQVAAMLETATPDPAVLEIEKQLLAKDQIRERVRKAAEDLQRELSPDDLDDLQARAKLASRQLDEWQKTLTQRSQVLDQNRTALKQLRDTWSLTLDQSRGGNAPAELIDGIKLVRSELRDADKQLEDRFDAVLKLQGLVTEESLAVSVLAQDVRRARFEVRGRLLERNRPSLIAAFRDNESAEPVLTRVRDGLGRDARAVRTFASIDGGLHLIAQAVLFLAFLAMALRMRRWIADRTRSGKAPGPFDAVFEHPISTAVLLAVLVTPWIHDYAPRAYVSWVNALAIVPVLLLLPQLLTQSHRPIWYALVGAFVADRIRYVFQPVELIERTLLVLTLALAAWALWGLLRRDHYVALVDPRRKRALGMTLRFALAALVVGIVADVVGFVSLANLVGLGVLRAIWGALALYAAVSIARSVFAALVRTHALKQIHLIQNRRTKLERGFGRLVGVAAALWWAVRVLDSVTLADPFESEVAKLVGSPIPLGAISFSLGDVVLFFATAGAGILLSRIVRTALEEDVFPRTHLVRGVPHAISATVRYAILLGAFLLAAAAAGFDWSRITLLAGAFGVGIGFGLQNIVNNFISGLILLYERPIQVGDTVEVGSLVGEVKRIGIRSSSVRTWQGAEVIVPNGNLISEQVVNWTLSDRTRRIEVPVGVGYAAEPERVQALLEEVGRSHPDVMPEPAPMAVLTGFGESAINFELRVWTANFDRSVRVRSEIAVAVLRALRAAQIEIPFPRRDVRLVPPSGGETGRSSL